MFVKKATRQRGARCGSTGFTGGCLSFRHLFLISFMQLTLKTASLFFGTRIKAARSVGNLQDFMLLVTALPLVTIFFFFLIDVCRPVVSSEESSLHIPESHGEVVEKNKPCTQKHAQKQQSFPCWNVRFAWQ